MESEDIWSLAHGTGGFIIGILTLLIPLLALLL